MVLLKLRYSCNYIPGEETSAVTTFSVDISDVVTPVKQKQIITIVVPLQSPNE